MVARKASERSARETRAMGDVEDADSRGGEPRSHKGACFVRGGVAAGDVEGGEGAEVGGGADAEERGEGEGGAPREGEAAEARGAREEGGERGGVERGARVGEVECGEVRERGDAAVEELGRERVAARDAELREAREAREARAVEARVAHVEAHEARGREGREGGCAQRVRVGHGEVCEARCARKGVQQARGERRKAAQAHCAHAAAACQGCRHARCEGCGCAGRGPAARQRHVQRQQARARTPQCRQCRARLRRCHNPQTLGWLFKKVVTAGDAASAAACGVVDETHLRQCKIRKV